MKKKRRRKCLHCRDLFRPDPRNHRHQRYCSERECQRASRAASQRRWLAKPANREYFRGRAHVERVRAWRAAHPRYWRSAAQRRRALQEDSLVQAIEAEGKTASLMALPLQELSHAQPLVLMGLIAHLTGAALQEDISRTARSFRELAQDILSAGATEPAGAPQHRRAP